MNTVVTIALGVVLGYAAFQWGGARCGPISTSSCWRWGCWEQHTGFAARDTGFGGRDPGGQDRGWGPGTRGWGNSDFGLRTWDLLPL